MYLIILIINKVERKLNNKTNNYIKIITFYYIKNICSILNLLKPIIFSNFQQTFTKNKTRCLNINILSKPLTLSLTLASYINILNILFVFHNIFIYIYCQKPRTLSFCLVKN